DTSTANNVSLLASNGVTVGQSIYVAPNTSGATRTIGITGGGTNTFSNEIFLGGDLTIDAGSSATDRVNIDGAIIYTNTYGIIKSNAGTAVLSGNNTYIGATTISGGTLRLGAANRISDSSAVSVSSGATFDLANNNETVGSIAGAGSINLGTGQLTAGQAGNATTTFSGVISGSGGAFIKLGTGTTTFSGSSANTYSGVTTINDGQLTLAKTAGVNAIAGDINLGDGSGGDFLALGADNQISDTSVITISGNVAGSRGGFRLYGYNETIGGLSGVGLVEFGDVGSGSSTLTLNVTGNYTNNGVIRNTGVSATGTLALVKSGSGTQVLTGANSYTGGTLVSAGVLEGVGGSSLQGNITNNATVNFNQTTTN
ncbi:MAG: hypothetical protein EBS49_09280, partial [Verrucomicrobia bacterium]|nr:hypothetical protein [Verrucomicrobiota bacterium]